MSLNHHIYMPFATWMSWTRKQRGEYTAYMDAIGQKWTLLIDDKGQDVESDYRNEARRGGYSSVRDMMQKPKQSGIG